MVRKATVAETAEIGGMAPTNGAANTLTLLRPYTAQVTLRGTADMLFHRWNVEGIEAKAGAAKGSKAKKSDDVESYVYRNDDGDICIPGEYLRQTIVNAAKYRQDPRSPRKSAMDLFKAGIVTLTPLASLGVKKWDYEHRCRVQIQRNGVTRTRPAIKAGWVAEFLIQVNLPQYIAADDLQAVIQDGGMLIGLADFRPTYGRYLIQQFELLRSAS